MKHLLSRLSACLLALLAWAASEARADYMNWSYSSTTTPTVVPIDARNSSGGWVGVTGVSNGTSGTSIPVLALVTATDTSGGFRSTYTLKVTITDNTTHDTGTLSFTGTTNGDLIHTSSSMTTSFNGPQSVTVDGHVYTLNIATLPLVPPAGQSQNIVASVTVSGGANTPEPTSLTLAALGTLGCIGCVRRRRKIVA